MFEVGGYSMRHETNRLMLEKLVAEAECCTEMKKLMDATFDTVYSEMALNVK